jgi:hypothetical protein
MTNTPASNDSYVLNVADGVNYYFAAFTYDAIPQYSSGVHVSANTDMDADGLTDWWEVHYLGGLQYNQNDDPDGDGMSNLSEYRSNTDPLDSGSVFKVDTISVNNDGSITIGWTSAPQERYAVYYSEDMKRWTEALIFPGTDLHSDWTDDGMYTGVSPQNSQQRFYKIQLQR